MFTGFIKVTMFTGFIKLTMFTIFTDVTICEVGYNSFTLLKTLLQLLHQPTIDDQFFFL